MIVERLIYGNRIKEISDRLTLPNAVRMVLTFCIVSFAWIFFRAENFGDASGIIGKIFTDFGRPFIDTNTFSMALIALAIVFLKDFADEFVPKVKLLDSKVKVVRYATAVLLICYILGFGVLNGGSFIYFQF